MEAGFVTEERIFPGRQSSLYFVFAFFRNLFSNCRVFGLFVVGKLFLEFKDFLYFIFKSLVHSCVVVSHGP